MTGVQISGFWPVFLAGAFGGFLLEVLRWWRLREAMELPRYRTSLFYWTITAVMICTGGFIATLYGIETRSALMVVNLGASAPALIGALAHPGTVREADQRPRTRSESQSHVQRSWWWRARMFLSFSPPS